MPPLLAELAAVLPASSDLVDRLVTEFAPTAATLSTPQAYWVGLNGWMTDRLSGPIMEGKVTADEIGAQAWAVYASSYWGALELREHWGMPPAMKRMGMTLPTPPFPDVQQGIVTLMNQRMAAVRDGGDACLRLLPSILREPSTSGPIHGVGYNAGVQVVKTEDPPIGQRRPGRPARALGGAHQRARFPAGRLRPAGPPVPEGVALCVRAGGDGPSGRLREPAGRRRRGGSLRDIWKNAVAFGNLTWGGDAQDNWTEAYWEETIRWSSILTFGMEATGLAAFVALLNSDPDAATRAVLGNALYLGATPGWLVGLLDVRRGTPPDHGGVAACGR